MNPWYRVPLRLVFPAVCLLCPNDRPSDSTDPFCPSCRTRFRWEPLSEYGGSEFLPVIHSAATFSGVMREVLHQFKYAGRDYLAGWLGPSSLSTLGIERNSFDCVVSVPMSPLREWKRGYNQAYLLAASISRTLDLPLVGGWLGCRSFTVSQIQLNRSARKINARKKYFLKRKRGFPYRKALLVDDVKTTGATLRRCAGLLRLAGARRVEAMVIARDIIDDPWG